MTECSDAIALGLSQIRKRRRLALATFFSFLPAVLLVGALTQSDTAATCTALLWAMIFIITASRSWASKCPRCGWQFCFGGSISNPFASKCTHCGLSIHARQG
jgi:DNA-directed RNA polymerase subunit RPC12/RpoP